MLRSVLSYCLILLALIQSFSFTVKSQEAPTESVFEDAKTETWFGSYGNFRISEKLYWAGEFHLRMAETENTPLVGYLSKVYNRHGIKYVFSKNFSATAGGVLRLNLTSKNDKTKYNKMVLEPRLWHEYLFAMPFERFMVYHRLRFEHRWSKPNDVGAEFIYRNRYRYMFQMKIPINKPKLVPGTYYFSPFIELIMQSGKSVVSNPLEDLRLYPHVGYIYNTKISFSAGMLYTTGQSTPMGYSYRKRWIPRVNIYISLDLRKDEMKIPDINLRD
ncbi:MAG: DUF2490 domain-containing protein [Brumimicrobium sp.]